MAPQVTSAFRLRELHPIATYEERREMQERDQILHNKQLALRGRVQEFRRERRLAETIQPAQNHERANA